MQQQPLQQQQQQLEAHTQQQGLMAALKQQQQQISPQPQAPPSQSLGSLAITSDPARTVAVWGFPSDMKRRELGGLLWSLPGFLTSQLTWHNGGPLGIALFASHGCAAGAVACLRGLDFDVGDILGADLAAHLLVGGGGSGHGQQTQQAQQTHMVAAGGYPAAAGGQGAALWTSQVAGATSTGLQWVAAPLDGTATTYVVPACQLQQQQHQEPVLQVSVLSHPPPPMAAAPAPPVAAVPANHVAMGGQQPAAAAPPPPPPPSIQELTSLMPGLGLRQQQVLPASQAYCLSAGGLQYNTNSNNNNLLCAQPVMAGTGSVAGGPVMLQPGVTPAMAGNSAAVVVQAPGMVTNGGALLLPTNGGTQPHITSEHPPAGGQQQPGYVWSAVLGSLQ